MPSPRALAERSAFGYCGAVSDERGARGEISFRRRALRLALRLVGPALLVVVLLRIDDPGLFGETLARTAWAPLAGAFALNALVLHLKIERWRILMRSRGYRYPLGRSYVAFLASAALGMVTPGRVGDALRVQYVRHEIDMPYAEGLAVVVMDRLCDMYVLLAFVAVGVTRFARVLSDDLALVSWIGVAAIALGPLVLLVPGLAERLMGRIYARLARGREGLDRFLAALRGQVGRVLVVALPLTAVTFAVNYLQGYLISASLGLGISYYDVMCMLAVTSLLSLLPISVAGVGVRESFLAVVFPALALHPAEGVAFGMVVLAVIYLVWVIFGSIAWQLSPPPEAVRRAALR